MLVWLLVSNRFITRDLTQIFSHWNHAFMDVADGLGSFLLCIAYSPMLAVLGMLFLVNAVVNLVLLPED